MSSVSKILTLPLRARRIQAQPYRPDHMWDRGGRSYQGRGKGKRHRRLRRDTYT